MSKSKSKKSRKRIIQLCIIFYIAGFFVYETYLYKTFEFHIIGGEKSLLIDTNNTDFIWGLSENISNINTNKTTSINPEKQTNLIGKNQKFGNSSFVQLSKNSGIFSQSQKKILFFSSDFDEDELPVLFSHPVDLMSDFWVSTNSSLPLNKITPPTKGFLYLGSRNPGKKLREFCIKNKIPLVTYTKTKGFRISLNKKNSWEIFTEN